MLPTSDANMHVFLMLFRGHALEIFVEIVNSLYSQDIMVLYQYYNRSTHTIVNITNRCHPQSMEGSTKIRTPMYKHNNVPMMPENVE